MFRLGVVKLQTTEQHCDMVCRAARRSRRDERRTCLQRHQLVAQLALQRIQHTPRCIHQFLFCFQPCPRALVLVMWGGEAHAAHLVDGCFVRQHNDLLQPSNNL